MRNCNSKKEALETITPLHRKNKWIAVCFPQTPHKLRRFTSIHALAEINLSQK